MSKSKSHPCKHPKKARRFAVQVGFFWCHKCKQTLDANEPPNVVKPEDLITVPVIMEGSPSGT